MVPSAVITYTTNTFPERQRSSTYTGRVGPKPLAGFGYAYAWSRSVKSTRAYILSKCSCTASSISVRCPEMWLNTTGLSATGAASDATANVRATTGPNTRLTRSMAANDEVEGTPGTATPRRGATTSF